MWFKVDDKFHSHEKVIAVSLAARGLWITCGSWSAGYERDGFVPVSLVRSLSGVDAAGELVEVGMWRVVEGGWQFHDWGDFQTTKDENDAKRDEARARMARARAGKKQSRSQDVRANISEVRECSDNPDPDPDPDPSDDDSLVIDVTTDRAREPDDWAAIPDEQRFAFAAIGVDGTAWVRALTTAGIRVRSPREAVEVAQWVLGKTIAEKENPTGYVMSALGRSRDEIADYVVGADLGAA